MQSIVRLYLTDDPISHHATYSFVNAHPSSSISDLQNGRAMSVAYASYEDGYWLLDGKYKFLPSSNAHIGYMSAGMTDELGQSTQPLGTIHVQFDQAFDMDEISIHGNEISNDYATRVLVRYLNSKTVLQDLWINPNQVHYTFSNPITNVDEIHFTFYGTNKPYRRARVTGINYGDTVEFLGDQVEKANVVMEQSSQVTELPYGTFTSYLRSSEPIFDTIDPDSLYSQLKNRMIIDVMYDNTREVDFVGRYWMTKKEHVTDYRVQIEGMDLIGLLKDTTYNGDFWITNASFSTIINRILSFSNDVKTISIDSDVAEIQLRGNIAPGNVREAFQQALFAAGCSAEIVNGDELHIFRQRFLDINGTPTGTFTRAEKALDNQSMTDTTPVTKIELTSYSYAQGTTTVTMFNETLTGGTYTIQFDKPTIFTQSNVTNATLLDSGPNFAIIDVTGTKEVTITGTVFTPSQIVNTRDIDLSGAKPNTIKIQDATMVSPDSALATLTRMQFFYLLRFQQQFRVFNPLWYRPGYIYRVDTIKDRQVAIIAERTEIDLSSGFVCDITGTGVVLGNVLIQKRDIVVDDKGSVTPSQFEYPRSGPQNFVATLFADYQEDYGIGVTINGVRTLYMADSAPFVLAVANASTAVAIDFPQIMKAITIGDKGTVTPSKFRYPQNTSQSFTVALLSGYSANDYSIKVSINGVVTDYREVSTVTFTLPTTTASTEVAVTFPEVLKRTITAGSGITVTPAVFKYPWTAEQSFTATITSDDPYKYYVRITINGVSTDYDITEKPFTLSNTTADTTVSIAKVLKSSRLVDVNTDVIPENYVALTGGEMLTYYYPVSNSQTVHSEVHYAPDPFSGPSGWTAATATFTWYVNDVLFAQHTAVQYSDFSIATATSSTMVRCVVTNFAGGGSGGGGEGGGGYISWYALTNADYIIRSAPSVSSGSYVAGTYYTTQVLVTDQGTGDEISGSNLWYKVTITNNPMDTNTVGLSGWIHRFGIRSGTNPN